VNQSITDLRRFKYTLSRDNTLQQGTAVTSLHLGLRVKYAHYNPCCDAAAAAAAAAAEVRDVH